MMSSIKFHAPKLAGCLGTTEAALYERQRVLARAGLLNVGRGRGPGSGVQTTPHNVAILVLSFMAAETPATAVHNVSLIAGARSSEARPRRSGNPSNLLEFLELYLE